MAVRVNHVWLLCITGLLILVGALAPAVAAPILGQNQEQQITEPPTTPIIRPTELNPRATVIQFSVLPSPANPKRFETTIIVQQDGGRQICVNHTSPVIIVRSYQTDADPFAPDIPSKIEGEQSGDVGELAGFNKKKIFIRPRETDDRFDVPEERFSVGQYEGVFGRDENECDQELTEGDFVCLDEVIRTEDCNLAQHAELLRELRVMLALNSIPIIAPAAGRPLTQQAFGFNPGVIDPPTGFTAAPNFSGSFGGAGGDGLILVPHLIGLPFSNAVFLITSTGFVLGKVTSPSSDTASIFQDLFISTAHAQPVPNGMVTAQQPIGGSRVPPGTLIDIIVTTADGGGGGTIPVPEPSSSSMFILGLLLIVGMYLYLRRRSRPGLTQN